MLMVFSTKTYSLNQEKIFTLVRNQLVNFLNVTKDDQKTITNTVSYKRKQNQTCFPRCGIEAKFTNKYKSVSLAPVLTYG